MGQTAFWYCENCKEVVDPINITFNKTHTKCGHAVDWFDSNPIGNEKETIKDL